MRPGLFLHSDFAEMTFRIELPGDRAAGELRIQLSLRLLMEFLDNAASEIARAARHGLEAERLLATLKAIGREVKP